jgi:D-xylose transport system substrate-binding protein
MSTGFPRVAGAAVALGLGAAGLSACTGGDSAGDATSATGVVPSDSRTVALLLPDSGTPRYEAVDRPAFDAAVRAACSDCEVVHDNAEQDAAEQERQAEDAIAQGADVLVLAAVDGEAAVTIVDDARAQGVPVVAYERFVAGSDYHVSSDDTRVGELQGEGLIAAMEAEGHDDGDIIMVNGAPTAAAAADVKAGAHDVLDASDYTVAAEYDAPDGSPDAAREWMENQVDSLPDDLVGVYAATDGIGGGVLAAMRSGDVDPLPPVTGRGAELAAIQRIVSGEQALTVHPAIEAQARDAAMAALALADGRQPRAATDTDGVPTTLLDPVVVTRENIGDTVVAAGLYPVEDICTAEYADACTELGIG